VKGINIRKIAALASGIALLGASVAVADVVYGNTQLVDQNGQPVVKVVVGANAAASDGVAAGNIAARIANLAYKSSTLTATVSGEAACSVGGANGSTGAGSCAVTNKKANLEITLPGVTAGAYQFTTLIADYIDRMPGNRNTTSSDDIWSSSSDTSTTMSGLYGGATATEIRGTQNVFKISGAEFAPFASATVTDTSGSKTYSETQAMWIYGETYFSTSADAIVAKFSGIGYTAKFDSGDYGIMVCTGSNYDYSNYNACAIGDNEHINTHKAEIQFLGQTWIISELTPPLAVAGAYNLNSTTTTLLGGSVKLAKSSQSGIINVGDELDAGTVKIRLSDISVATGSGNAHPAIVDILDANGALLQQTSINEGTTYSYTTGGTTVKIHVYKTAPGFTLNAKWADMAIFTDELLLKNTEKIDASSGDPNYDWKAYIRWKNKGWASGGNYSNSQADNLREIIIYDPETYSGKTAGQSINIIGDPIVYQLQYDGLSLASSDYDRLKFSIVNADELGSVALGTPIAETNMTSNTTCGDDAAAITGKVIKVESGISNAFKIPNSGGDTVNKFYVRYLTNSSAAGNVTGAVMLYYQPSTAACDYWQGGAQGFSAAGAAVASLNTTGGSEKAVAYETVGTGTAQGYLSFVTGNASSDGGNLSIYIQEDAGKVNSVSANYDSFVFQAIGLSSASSFEFKARDSDNSDRIMYNSVQYVAELLEPKSNLYDAPLISERGSKFIGLSSDTVEFDVAKKIADAKYVLMSSGTESTSNVLKKSLAEGEETELTGGIKVKVDTITQTVGSCVAGAVAGSTPDCTVDSSGVSAVISPNNAASVEVSEPYLLSSDLVVLDSNAAGVGKVISVGGPAVNSVTREALAGSDVDFATKSVVVQEVGNTIVVAGYSAADTLTAAGQFIAGIQKQ